MSEPGIPQEKMGSGANEKNGSPFIITVSVTEESIDAFNQFLASLQPESRVTLIVFATPGLKSETLAKKLVAAANFTTSILAENVSIAPQHIYIVPAAKYIALEKDKISFVDQSDRILSPLEVFLTSVALQEKSRSIVLLFTPWVAAYAEGIKPVREVNGLVLQLSYSPHSLSESEAPFFALLVDGALSPEVLADRVTSFVTTEKAFSAGLSLQQEDIQSLEKIYHILHKATGIRCSDFDLIFILQHIQQRLLAQGKSSITAYAEYINQNPREAWLLARRLSINVSGFFYERATMQMIVQDIIPELHKTREGEIIRTWMPACSTGEEVLSLAILLHDFGINNSKSSQLQLIGTETDDTLLHYARQAQFFHNNIHAVPQEFRTTYFEAQNDRLTFSRQLLQNVHFAQFDLNNTSPYANLDLIYYRGHLNKLKKDVQQKVLKNLHTSLSPDGFLIIGKDDHIGSEVTLFTPVDTQGIVYKPRQKPKKAPVASHTVNLFRKQDFQESLEKSEKNKPSHISQLHRDLLLQLQNPVSILVKQDFTILDQCGQVGMFIAWPNNGKTANLLTAFPLDVREDLQNAVQQAVTLQKTLKSKVMTPQRKGILKPFLVHVRPLDLVEDNEPVVQVMFLEPDAAKEEAGLSPHLKGQSLNTIVNKLEADLRQSKSRLNTLSRQLEEARSGQIQNPQSAPVQPKVVDKLQQQNTELKTTNKELLALNRDLVRRIEEIRKRANPVQSDPPPPQPVLTESLSIDGAVSSLLSKQILKLTTNRHEIRTALTSIMGFADLIGERVVDKDNKELAKYISKAGHRLSDSLAELLEGDFDEYEVFDKPEEEKPAPEPSSLSDRLLVVEDSEATRRLLSLVLSDRFECELAADASEAIEKAGKERFKAVLMDINLGAGQSGVEVLQHLRRQDPYQRVPFMAVTAMASPRDESILRRKGFNAYLAKPFQKSKLLSTLEQMLLDNTLV